LQTTWRESVLPLADQMDVDIHLPNVSPQPYTHLAHEGFQFACEHNHSNEYTQSVFRAFFQDGRDIGKIHVLTEIAADVGLSPEDFRNALTERTYRTQHQNELQYAKRKNVQAVPTFLIDGIRLRGLVSKEQLKETIERANS